MHSRVDGHNVDIRYHTILRAWHKYVSNAQAEQLGDVRATRITVPRAPHRVPHIEGLCYVHENTSQYIYLLQARHKKHSPFQIEGTVC